MTSYWVNGPKGAHLIILTRWMPTICVSSMPRASTQRRLLPYLKDAFDLLYARRASSQDDGRSPALPARGSAGTGGGLARFSKLHRRARARLDRAPARHSRSIAPRASGAGHGAPTIVLEYHRLDQIIMTRFHSKASNTTDAAGFVAALGDIYEQRAVGGAGRVGQRPFGTLAALHEP